MMRRKNIVVLIIVSVMVSSAFAVYYLKSSHTIPTGKYAAEKRLPKIRPDYFDTVIPVNIAPLNFLIEEEGEHYYVRIYSSKGEDIYVSAKDGKIKIPMNQWKRLLELNRGNELYFDVYIKRGDGEFIKFDSIINLISDEEIDKYLVYRLIKPLYNRWVDISIHQRNLEDYDESLIFSNKSINGGCVNCHTFLKNSGENALMHIRSAPKPTMYLIRGSSVRSIFSQTPFSSASMAYSSWHPDGRYIAFSVNKVQQFFHTSRDENRDVVDNDSAIGIYDTETNTIMTPRGLSQPDILETYPCWSPDGNYLYYCSSPILWSDRNIVPPENYENVKYSLMRISFNRENGNVGEPESILSSEQTNMSIVHPKISPDGRFLLFCMANYGCFSIYQPSSDLYMMDLKTLEYERLAINSDKSDSYHSWSSNSKWIVFSSKRLGDIFARPFLSYINYDGKACKPILLPQEDPEFYDSFIKTYNVPELINVPINVKKSDFERAIGSPENISGIKQITKASPVTGKDPLWKQFR
ncbi:TolB family protein [candidate division KSB1 bacterium]